MDLKKVAAITKWEAPTTVKGVRGFLGFANFYRRFIKGFSDIVRPLTELTQKDRAFQWTVTAAKAFEQLKAIVVTAPILVQFDYKKETRLETDSSGFYIKGTL